MPMLFTMSVGDRARIVRVQEHALTVRMASMGIRPGAEVRLLARAASGGRVVRVGDARLTLGRDLACGVEVELLHVQ